MKLPTRKDMSAVLAWIDPLIPTSPRDWLIFPWHKWHPPFSEVDREREAIKAAKQGSFELLGHLMDPGHSVDRPKRLSIEAEQLVAARLIKKFKGRRSRPKQTEAKRRANNKNHDAADEVPIIQNILVHYYPNEHGIREWAIDIAAKRAGIRRNNLANFLRNKKNRIKPAVTCQDFLVR